jgi:hypothetical protein
MKIRGESGAVPSRGGGGSGGGGRVSAPPKAPKTPKEPNPAISVRKSTVDTGTNRMVKKQNRAAESYKIKDLDKFESGQKYRAAQKLKKEAELKAKIKNAENKGKAKGAAAAIGIGVTAAAVSKNKKKTGK